VEIVLASQERTEYLVPEWDDNAGLERMLKRYATKISQFGPAVLRSRGCANFIIRERTINRLVDVV